LILGRIDALEPLTGCRCFFIVRAFYDELLA